MSSAQLFSLVSSFETMEVTGLKDEEMRDSAKPRYLEKRKRTVDYEEQTRISKWHCNIGRPFHNRVEKRKRMEDESDGREQMRISKCRYQEQRCRSGSSTEAYLHPESLQRMCTAKGHHYSHHSAIPSPSIDKQFRLVHSQKTELKDHHSYHPMEAERPKLVIDLDHILLDSTQLMDLSHETEIHLIDRVLLKKEDKSLMLYRLDLDEFCLLVKLRPFARQFIQDANNLFDICLYTMGSRGYATEMVKLLDPGDILFPSKVIKQVDSSQRGEKDLNEVGGSKACTVIIDDKLSVWREEDRENIIQIKRYNYFQSSCLGSYSGCRSLASQKIDEREADGTLSSILSVLKCAYQKFVQMNNATTGSQGDFRRILKDMRLR